MAITCPECGGRKGERFGPLFLACQFCGGVGRVDESASQAPAMGGVIVWEDPVVRARGVCGVCLGSRQIVFLGGASGATRSFRTAPCPACGG